MTWPNWIDLIIVTLLLITCYNGFSRGLLSELLRCVAALVVSVTAVVCWPIVAGAVQSWLGTDPTLTACVGFWVIFLLGAAIMRWVVAQFARAIQGERVHWMVQGLGGILGALRGIWWAGFVVLALSSSGFTYLQESVEQRSLFGPSVETLSRQSLEYLSQRVPGWEEHPIRLIPPMKEGPS